MPGTVGPAGQERPNPSILGYRFAAVSGDRTYALSDRAGGAVGGGVGSAETWRAGGRSGFARCTAQLTPLLLRQAVVLLPLLFSPVFFPAAVFHLLVALARGLAFLGRELCPRCMVAARAPARRVSFSDNAGDTDPLALALWLRLSQSTASARESAAAPASTRPTSGFFLRCAARTDSEVQSQSANAKDALAMHRILVEIGIQWQVAVSTQRRFPRFRRRPGYPATG